LLIELGGLDSLLLGDWLERDLSLDMGGSRLIWVHSEVGHLVIVMSGGEDLIDAGVADQGQHGKNLRCFHFIFNYLFN